MYLTQSISLLKPVSTMQAVVRLQYLHQTTFSFLFINTTNQSSYFPAVSASC